MIRLLSLLLLLLAILGEAGCSERGRQQAATGKLQVVATIFPAYDFARVVGGDRVDVRLLLPPGVEPHNFEPKPEETLRVARADLFIFTSAAMEPWAADLQRGLAGGRQPRLVEAGRGIALLPAAGHEDHDEGHREAGHRHSSLDPHIWLDPVNAMAMVENIAAAFSERDPANAAYYRTNADRHLVQLRALDERFRQGLTRCPDRTFLHGGHYAFAYLARRYGLTYLSAYGISADSEPTPRRMVELVRQVKSRGLTAIFAEELLSPAVAETIARETGARVLRLHGIHNVTRQELERGVSYLSLMDENLNNLRSGLRCP